MNDSKGNNHTEGRLENYKEYKKNWDKKRRTTRRDPETLLANKSNMEFFTRILRSMKLTYRQFAEKSGVSQQMVSWWITSDDCKLKNIISSFEKIGIDISCHFEPLPGSKFVIQEDNYSINIDSLPDLTKKSQAPMLVIDQVLEQNGNLRFIAKLIDGLGLDIKSFCQQLDLSYTAIYQWFKKDDIKISKIYEIADKLQQKVVWDLKRKES